MKQTDPWRRLLVLVCPIALVILSPALSAGRDHGFDEDLLVLKSYRTELQNLRDEGRPTIKRPGPAFFVFGMGPRPKFIYREGELIEWPSGRVAHKWVVQRETIVPPTYAVWLKTSNSTVHIFENERGIFLEEGGKQSTLADLPVHLPNFKGENFPNTLRVLYEEILVNIVGGKPMPNFLVYTKPWYRDAAMNAMVLRRTGNIALMRDWILSLRDPFDHNARVSEADNPGEVLYLISCVSDRNHPLVPAALKAADAFKKGEFISGPTDGAEHPVYQTKWLKFGMSALGIANNDIAVPKTPDSYASLFWWSYNDGQIGPEFSAADAQNYPYLAWARDHLTGGHAGPLLTGDYPLSWEAHASEADYKGMSMISANLTRAEFSAPHSWHAAEMFLSLLSHHASF